MVIPDQHARRYEFHARIRVVFYTRLWVESTTLLKLLPSSSPQIREIETSLQNLKPRVEAAQQQETAEMLGKLEGLGNTILGASILASVQQDGELTYIRKVWVVHR